MDFTEISKEIRSDKGEGYLLSIIDFFSKFGYNYILNNKKAEIMLSHIKDFINKYGKPLNIHTDNGKEFVNKLIENFCENNNINIIKGRAYHPQTQGWVKSFNKEIKRLLLEHFLEKKRFSIYTQLPEVIKIYNNIHSSTKYMPIDLFNANDKTLIKKGKPNIKTSQNK